MPPRSRASTAAAAAASADVQSTPAVADASPRGRGHRRQWTHSQLDGSKELRLHRSPVAPDAAAAAEAEDDAAAEGDEKREDEEKSASTPAPAPKSRRRTATPAAVAAPSTKAGARKSAAAAAQPKKGREQRQLFTKPDTVDEAEEEEEEAAEEEDEEEKEQPQSATAAAESEDEDQGMEADFSGHDQPAAAMQTADDDDEEEQEEEQDNESADEAEDDEEEEEGDDAFVAEMADWAAAELSRRLKAPPAAAAAAASSSFAAAAAAASSTKARPASASSRAAQSSTSDLNSLFVPRMEGGTAHTPSGQQAIPHGFQRKSGVLLLSDSALTDALAADRSSNHAPSAVAAPDLMAALGSRSAAKQLPSSNPLQASKQASKDSNAPASAGKDWFNLSRPSVITTEMKTDLKLLSLRAYMDPKKFFKKSGKNARKKVVPTFFQMGTVIAGAHEFYSSRLTNSERHDHFADEFIDPALNRGAVKKTKHYLKRKVMEVQAARTPVSTKKYSNKNKTKLEDIARRPGSNKGGAGGGKKQRR